MHEHHHPAADGDPAAPDTELRPADVARRRFLQGLGLAGMVATGSAVGVPAHAGEADAGRYRWLAGDHHIHTQSSNDAMHTVAQQVDAGVRYGLDWMVITDHGHEAHEKFAVEQTYADVLTARRAHPRTLLWQGLEWNVPGGEHATVFFESGGDELTALRAFERFFDGNINRTNPSSAANEATALDALRWMSGQVEQGAVRSALMLANHPSRNGRYSPHEFRAYRDTAPHIAVGMEGAPGAQHDGAPAPGGSGAFRGGYGNSPGTDSWPGWPAEAYRTFGGFDWMTAQVGGLWDAMLAEGRGWWITTNSDIHRANGTTFVPPSVPDGFYDAHGRYPDPVDSGVPQVNADFWPGQFSRTVVGAAAPTFAGVMDGIRAGRVWVGMGGLVEDIDVRVTAGGAPATLGGRVTVRRGDDVTVRVRARLARTPNGSGEIPRLARMDLIRGAVTGPATDRDAFTAPDVAVVRSAEPGGKAVCILEHTFRGVQDPFYVRVRGTDGRRCAGLEPMMDVQGDADPWADLWCYANPVFVEVT